MKEKERIIDRPSPNHDARPDGIAIDILLLHYTGMQSTEAALDRLTDSEAKVSAHYLIDEDGRCYRMVDEARRAWHAGVAFWQGATNINARSIGIELANPGHQFGYRPFGDRQMECLKNLCKVILDRHPIPATRVLAHSDVAPDRKEDPGELFDWENLARNGIGMWPAESADAAEIMDLPEWRCFQKSDMRPCKLYRARRYYDEPVDAQRLGCISAALDATEPHRRIDAGDSSAYSLSAFKNISLLSALFAPLFHLHKLFNTSISCARRAHVPLAQAR